MEWHRGDGVRERRDIADKVVAPMLQDFYGVCHCVDMLVLQVKAGRLNEDNTQSRRKRKAYVY